MFQVNARVKKEMTDEERKSVISMITTEKAQIDISSSVVTVNIKGTCFEGLLYSSVVHYVLAKYDLESFEFIFKEEEKWEFYRQEAEFTILIR